MKNKFKWIGIALLSALLIFGLTGCPEESPSSGPSKQKGAELTDVLFGDVDANGNVTDNGVIDIAWGKQAGMIADEFEGLSSFSDQADVGIITLKDRAYLSGKAITLRVSVNSNKAERLFGVFRTPAAYNEDSLKESGETPASGIDASGRDFLVVKVTAEDGKNIKFWVFQVVTKDNVSAISYVRLYPTEESETFETADDPGKPATGAAPEWTAVTAGYFNLTKRNNEGFLVISNSSLQTTAVQKIEYAFGDSITEVPTSFATLAPPSGNPLKSPFIPSREYTDEEGIFIRVTSENGESVSLYIIEVRVGRDARLVNLKTNARESQSNYANVDILAILGTPQADFDDFPAANYGEFEPGLPQPTNGTGFLFKADTSDPDATVKIGKAAADTVPTLADLTSAGVRLPFLKDEFFYVEVTAANGVTKLCYKIEYLHAQETTIVYGRPQIKRGEQFIDELWDDPDVVALQLDVSRINKAELPPVFKFLNPVKEAFDNNAKGHTSAWARTMWDDTGIYVYVNVDVYDFYASETDAPRPATEDDPGSDGTVTQRVVYTGYVNDDTAHESDSVEMFINERLQQYSTGAYGNQFRITPPNTTNVNGSVSGAVSSQPTGQASTATVAGFRASTDYVSWVKKDGAGKDIGYVVIAKIPFGYATNASANEVFKDGLVDATDNDGPTVGFEIQLNTRSGASPARDAILTWNGINAQSYNNCGGYGRAKLILNGATRVIPDAPTPTITATTPADRGYTLAQLQNDEYTQSLTVTATATSGVLSYQWYSADNATAVTTPVESKKIDGATEATFKPPKTIVTAGDYFYYVVVTNTLGTGEGAKTATAISRVATVKVSAIEAPAISGQPTNGDFIVSTTAKELKVTATVGDVGSTLTYQWYSADTSAGTGTVITGATDATYTPVITTVGTKYYYAIVTNTLGANTETTKSSVARIRVYPVGTKLDHVVDLSGQVTSNTTGWADTYNAGLVFNVQKDGQPVSRTDYARWTMVIEYYSDAAHTEALPASAGGSINMKWFPTVVTGANDSGEYSPAYGIANPTTYTNATLRGTASNPISSISLQTGGTAPNPPLFIKVISITFHLAVDPGDPEGGEGPGPDPDTGLELGDATDWNQLKGTQASVTRTDKTIVYGEAVSGIDSLITGGNFAAEGDAKVRKGDTGFVYATGTTGNGENALQILKPGAVSFSDPKKVYRLNFTGRFSVTGNPADGRIELFEIGGASALANCTATNSTGISISSYGNGVNVSGTGVFNGDFILTENFAKNGLIMFVNQWGSEDPAEKVFSIDDLIVYTVDATAISNFAITLTAPIADVAAVTTIDATQFTGAVTWDPALVEGKFVMGAEYTATIIIKAKAGFHAEDLTGASFTINGTAASYTSGTKTVVSAAFPPAKAPPPAVTVDFTSIDFTEVTGTVSDKVAGGYNYTWGDGYGGFAKFKITIESGFSLTDYTSVIVNVASVGGDVANKPLALLAGTTLPGSTISNAHQSTYAVGTATFGAHTATGRDMTLVIDKTKAAGLTGEIEIAFYLHCGATGSTGGAGTATQYKFSNVRFVP